MEKEHIEGIAAGIAALDDTVMCKKCFTVYDDLGECLCDKTKIKKISTLLFELIHTLQLHTSQCVAVQFSVDQNIMIYRVIIHNPDTGAQKDIPVYIDMRQAEHEMSDEELFSKVFLDIIAELEKVHVSKSNIEIVRG